MEPIKKIAELFEEFPGIGPRQAKRFAYFLLSKSSAFLSELSQAMAELKRNIKICGECRRFFFAENSSRVICPICLDNSRDSSELMIVSKDIDLENIEKSGLFGGKYFVLGGTVPILEKNPEDKIRLRELLSVIEKKSKDSLKEIILAMNSTPEGENTEEYLVKILKPSLASSPVKLSVFGKGLSTGTEIEYSDKETLKNALGNRKEKNS